MTSANNESRLNLKNRSIRTTGDNNLQSSFHYGSPSMRQQLIKTLEEQTKTSPERDKNNLVLV